MLVTKAAYCSKTGRTKDESKYACSQSVWKFLIKENGQEIQISALGIIPSEFWASSSI
jgi:hypothetical protein